MNRDCITIQDVKDLIRDYNVWFDLKGTTLETSFPDPEEPSSQQLGERDVREKPVYEFDDESTKFRKTAHNTVIGLVTSPEFWRKTTAADQLTRFMQASGKQYGFLKITKRANQPLTLHFASPALALAFVRMVLENN